MWKFPYAFQLWPPWQWRVNSLNDWLTDSTSGNGTYGHCCLESSPPRISWSSQCPGTWLSTYPLTFRDTLPSSNTLVQWQAPMYWLQESPGGETDMEQRTPRTTDAILVFEPGRWKLKQTTTPNMVLGGVSLSFIWWVWSSLQTAFTVTVELLVITSFPSHTVL